MNVQISGDSWTDVAVALPALHGDGRVRLRVPVGIRCGAPRVMLDAAPLAVEVQQPAPDLLEVLVGPVVGGKLIFAARAIPPVVNATQQLIIEFDDAAPLVVWLAAHGSARFVAGRSGWSTPDRVAYGSQVDVTLNLRNDGTALLEDGLVHVALPVGVVPGFRCDRREVDAAGNRVLVLDAPALAVRASQGIPMMFALTEPGLTTFALRAQVSDRDGNELATFDSKPIAVEHQSRPTIVVHPLDVGPLRYGDDFRVQVTLAQGGPPMSDARLTVDGSYVATVELDLGSLQHGERRTLPISLRLANPSSKATWDDRLFFRLHSTDLDQPVSYNLDVPCAGRPLLRVKARIGEADEKLAHRVDIVVENRGDGIATAPVLQASRLGDTRAVVDSLSVDGQVQYQVDGSVPIFDAGVVLPDLGLGQRAIVSFLMRSGNGASGTVMFEVKSGEADASVLIGPVTIVAARRRGSGQNDDAGGPPLVVAEAFPESTSPLLAPSVGSVLVRAETQEPGLVYSLTWNDLGREYLDDGRVPLGRHVIALLSWLPIGAFGDEALDCAAVRVGAEVSALQEASSGVMRAGFWGVSGPSIVTPGLRAAAEALGKVQGDPPSDESQLAVLRWLIARTRVYADLDSWRDAVVNALERSEGDDGLLEFMLFSVLEPAA